MGMGVRDDSAADQAIFGSITVWHCVLKIFCPAYICIYNKFYQKSTLILLNTVSICKYFQVPVDPQVLENPWVFDSWLWVTWWLKPAQIQIWHFEFEIPVGTDRVEHGYTAGLIFPHRTRTCAHCNLLWVIPILYCRHRSRSPASACAHP